jgi:hypothetical protein
MPEPGSETLMAVHADTRVVAIAYALKSNAVYVKPYM